MIPAGLNTMIMGFAPPDFLELISMTTGTASDSSSNFNISLPAIEPNDLVVVSLTIKDNVAAPTINSSGWAMDSLTIASIARAALLSKVVDGSESVISCTSSKRHRVWVVRVYRSKTGRIPKISATSQGTHSGTSWNLPALTPDSGVHGTQKFTFIAAFSSLGGFNSPPAEYSDYDRRIYNITGSQIGAAIAHHESEAASDDPGTFTFYNVNNAAFQFAIWEE